MEVVVPQRTFQIRTLGCKANFSDSEMLESELRKRGWTPLADPAGSPELCIVNSCTVTDEADRQSRKLAARLRRTNPQATVVMTGCAAQVDPERLAGSPGITYVVGNQSKTQLAELILGRIEGSAGGADPVRVLGGVRSYTEMASRHSMDREWALPSNASELGESKTRAFLKIQEGCDAFCTYCVIPYGRGPSRSLSADQIVGEVSELVRRGIREVIITGTNIGDYGSDSAGGEGASYEKHLPELLERLLAETAIERIRLSSLDPVEITPRLMALMERESRLCPHFHVSLQSPHSHILKLMKRKYRNEEATERLQQLARLRTEVPVFVGMDIITGFPGETDEMFEWGVEWLRQMPWSRLHVFPYSERQGTPATRLPGSVPASVRASRAKRLMELSLERVESRARQSVAARGAAFEGAILTDVLLEAPRVTKGGERIFQGHTPDYLCVEIVAPVAGLTRNQIVRTEVIGSRLHSASGDVVILARALP